ncbi:sensor histidine kinase, partial [Intrasporangium sp.]|uniref:sensor histidine kinase n=1 Tax=Intrasporangium sp. TaxID=1925024 RepID=UPI00293A5112
MGRAMGRRASPSLFWRVCLINGGVFVVGTLALALSPATVSSRVLLEEAVVLVVGLAVIVVVNALLLRSLLHPLDRVRDTMARIDLRQPGLRLEGDEDGPAGPLVHGFNAMIDRLESERRVSTAEVLGAQEAERQRIAQELHDEIGQSLTAVLLGLKGAIDASEPEVARQLEGIRETARVTLEEVRRISQRLRPGVLEDLGLRGALTGLTSEFETTTGIPVERAFGQGLPALAPETELVLYRTAQEALTNIARHADARQASLSLSRRGGSVVLRVSDDGVGVGQGAAAGSSGSGTGIAGMRERARLVGGTVRVGALGRGGRGRGTEVVVEVPIDAP